MVSEPSYPDRVVYVVMGWDKRLTNDRVRKILRLRPHFDRLQLVLRGPNRVDEDEISIRAIPNPLALLRRLNLHRLRFRLEQILFFPNSHVLFTTVAKRRLRDAIREDLSAGKRVTLITCVPNHENTSIGLDLKRRYPEIRWVVDWQDLWTYDANYYDRVPKLYRPALERREQEVLALAGDVVAMERSGLVPEGGVPHRQAADALSRYDYVLVLLSDLANSRVVMSIKLPQYFLSGKPILALVPESSAIADIVKRTGTGYVIPTDGNWQEQLTEFLRDSNRPPVVRVPAEIEAFSWERLSAVWMAAITGDMNQLTSQAHAPPEG